jgi:hypothetical protein
MREHGEIRRSFELILDTEDCTLSDKLLVSNAIDGWQVVRGAGEVLDVDVLEFVGNRMILRVSLRQALTYKEINEYLEDLLAFAGEQTNYHVNIKPAGIRWDTRTAGPTGDRFDERLLISRSRRGEMLKNMDIRLQKEAESHSKPKYDLLPGACYISRERKSERAFEIFTDLVTHGLQGLCVSRLKPEAVRERYGLRLTPIVWLTQNAEAGEKCITPTDMPRVHFVISDFLDKAEKSVILLDGIEYIVTHNSFPSALKLVQLLNDRVMMHQSRLIVPVDPVAVGEKELALLERDMRPLDDVAQ